MIPNDDSDADIQIQDSKKLKTIKKEEKRKSFFFIRFTFFKHS